VQTGQRTGNDPRSTIGGPLAAESTPTASGTPTGESQLALVRRARRINRMLAVAYPDAHCELNFTTPLQLLIATVLSAQCTDARVNQVTPALFARYPTSAELAGAEIAEVADIIRPTGFYRSKAEHLVGLARMITLDYGGEVPNRLTDLVRLPGVGRKTANVVLGNAFGIPGITVDTHVGRLSRRLGWTAHTDPVAVEQDLAALFPRSEWTWLSHRLIFHGRRCCRSRSPNCPECPIAGLCPTNSTRASGATRKQRRTKGSV